MCSCGHSLGNTILANFQTSSLCRLHVFNFHTALLACVVDNVFIIFLTDLRGCLGFFILRNYFLTFSFSALPWWSNDPLVENLHLAIDHRPACQNLAPPWTLTPEMVPFGSKSVMLSMLIDAGEDLYWFDCINWPLTSRDAYFLEMLALVVSDSSFSAYLHLRRPAGLHRD